MPGGRSAQAGSGAGDGGAVTPTAGLSQGRLTFGMCVGVTAVAFESIAVTTAMPKAAGDLGHLAWYGWVFSTFQVGLLFASVVAGRMCDRLGPVRPLSLGMAIFAVGLIVAGSASDMVMLIVGRLIQGVGGGALNVALYVLIARVISEPDRPRVFSWVSTAWVLPSLAGPPVAAYLTDQLSWRWVFFSVLILVAVWVVLTVPNLVTVRRAGLDGGHPGSGAVPIWAAVLVAAAVPAIGVAGQRLDLWAPVIGVLVVIGQPRERLRAGQTPAASGRLRSGAAPGGAETRASLGRFNRRVNRNAEARRRFSALANEPNLNAQNPAASRTPGQSAFACSARYVSRGGGRFADRDPGVHVRLALAFDETIAGLPPTLHVVAEIIEHEVAVIRAQREDRVALVVLVLDDGHQQRLRREALLGEQLALQQRVILAVALAVGRVVPLVDDAPVIHVRDGFDVLVHPAIDALDFLERLGGQFDIARHGGACVAFALVALAKIDPAVGNAGDAADRRPTDIIRASEARAHGEGGRRRQSRTENRLGKFEEHDGPRCWGENARGLSGSIEAKTALFMRMRSELRLTDVSITKPEAAATAGAASSFYLFCSIR